MPNMPELQYPMRDTPIDVGIITRSTPSEMPRVEPAPYINVAEAEKEGYAMAGAFSEFKERQAALHDAQMKREDDARDKQILTAAIHNGIDLNSPDGLEKALQTPEIKRLSVSAYTNLQSHMNKRKQETATLSESLLKKDEAELKLAKDQNDQFIESVAPIYGNYETILKTTGDEKKAMAAFEASKAATLEMMSKQVSPVDGRPLYRPDELEKIRQSSPVDMKVKMDGNKHLQEVLHEAAMNKELESRSRREEALAEKALRGGDAKLEKAIVDGKESFVQYLNGKFYKDGKEVDATPVTSGGKSSALITGRYNPRTISAAKDVLNVLHTINDSPFETEGIFAGIGGHSFENGIFGSLKKFAANGLTRESAQRMGTIQLDLNRALGIALEMGGKSGENESRQLSNYNIKPGDTVGNAQVKLAGSAQIVRNALTAMETTNLPDSQRKEVEGILKELEKFPTQRELQEKYYKGTKKPPLEKTPAAKATGGTYQQSPSDMQIPPSEQTARDKKSVDMLQQELADKKAEIENLNKDIANRTKTMAAVEPTGKPITTIKPKRDDLPRQNSQGWILYRDKSTGDYAYVNPKDHTQHVEVK